MPKLTIRVSESFLRQSGSASPSYMVSKLGLTQIHHVVEEILSCRDEVIVTAESFSPVGGRHELIFRLDIGHHRSTRNIRSLADKFAEQIQASAHDNPSFPERWDVQVCSKSDVPDATLFFPAAAD